MKVKVNWGRNKGLVGTVIWEDKEKQLYMVDFHNTILVDGIEYPDAYYIAIKHTEECHETELV